MKTIKDLKKAIQDLPDDMEIGGSGHYGEYLECLNLGTESVTISIDDNNLKEIFCIFIESPGDEPL